jgi:hypothetical protein
MTFPLLIDFDEEEETTRAPTLGTTEAASHPLLIDFDEGETPTLAGVSGGAAVQRRQAGGGTFTEPLPSVDRRDLDRLETRLTGHTAAEVSQFFGEFGPMLIGAVKLASLGRTLGVKGLQFAARGKTTGRLGEVTRKAADVAGGRAVPKPNIQRAAEIAGGGEAVWALVPLVPLRS